MRSPVRIMRTGVFARALLLEVYFYTLEGFRQACNGVCTLCFHACLFTLHGELIGFDPYFEWRIVPSFYACQLVRYLYSGLVECDNLKTVRVNYFHIKYFVWSLKKEGNPFLLETPRMLQILSCLWTCFLLHIGPDM